jgi:carbon monoxide dehydrogenase subunit G
MIRVNREILIESVSPDRIFTVLSNPEVLDKLLPRLQKATLEESDTDRARLTLCLSIGSMFGTICFAGKLEWTEPEEIIFSVSKPLDAQIRWTLTPTEQGTIVKVTASLDLAPLLGPMVHFIPKHIPNEMIGKELQHALTELNARFEQDTTITAYPSLQQAAMVA